MRVTSVSISDAVRSPIGWRKTGFCANISSCDLLSQTVSGLLHRNHLEPAAVTEVHIIGAAIDQEDAASVCRGVGVPASIVLHAAGGCDEGPHQALLNALDRVGRNDVVVIAAIGSLATTGDSKERWLQQATLAESVAEQCGFERALLDRYATRSRERAREVDAMGEFVPEIIPIAIGGQRSGADEAVPVEAEMPPGNADVLAPGWRLTARNIAWPAAGAAALLVVDERRGRELGLAARARILSSAACAGPAGDPLDGMLRATSNALALTGLDVDQLDHYEVDETFPSISLAWRQAFGVDDDRVNPRGGAIALGDLGAASPLRMLVTTLSALSATGGQYGIQVLQGARGAGEAIVIERLKAPTAGPATNSLTYRSMLN